MQAIYRWLGVKLPGHPYSIPIAAGSCALLMEWGIVRGNDVFLYGEKVKAYLRRGARALPGFDVYPNPQVGYGRLNLVGTFDALIGV